MALRDLRRMFCGGDFAVSEKHNCCWQCPRRTAVPNCHNVETCPDWAKHVEERDARRAAIEEQKARERDISELEVNGAERRQRRRRHH